MNDQRTPFPLARPLAALAATLLLASSVPGQQDGARDDDGEPAPNIVAGARPRAMPEPNPRARLAVDPEDANLDLGTVRQGVVLRPTFDLRSAGEEPLIISHAQPSCGCLVGEIRTRPSGEEEFARYEFGEPIEPGAEIRIETVVDTIPKQDRTQISIQLFTNELRQHATIGFSVEVVPFLRAVPASLPLGDIPFRTGAERVVEIGTSGGEAVALSVDESWGIELPAGMTFDLEPLAPDEDGRSNRWSVFVRIDPDAPEGPGGHTIRLASDVPLPETDHVRKRRETLERLGRTPSAADRSFAVSVVVNYRVLGEIDVTPKSIPTGLVTAGSRIERTIELLSADPEFDLAGVAVEIRGQAGTELADADRYSVDVEPVEGRNALAITLSIDVPPDAEPGGFRGELLVRTGHPRKPEFTVVFAGVVGA